MRMAGNQQEVTLLAGVIGLALLFLLLLHGPVRLQAWLYPLARQAAQAKIQFETRHMERFETEHFVIKYTPADQDSLALVGEAAEAAYRPVTQMMGYQPAGKTLIVIYPDKTELRKAFGWSGDQSAMGVYWGGAIQLLSPQAWLQQEGDQKEQFIRTGPMVHEYTHLVFDYMTNGNYPRWFTEGLAQYVEYRVNRYEWVTPQNKLTGDLYSMAELEGGFDDLPNQALAYRESLAAIRYIAEVHGQDKLNAIISRLQQGVPVKTAIEMVLGMDYEQFNREWPAWARDHMQQDTWDVK